MREKVLLTKTHQTEQKKLIHFDKAKQNATLLFLLCICEWRFAFVYGVIKNSLQDLFRMTLAFTYDDSYLTEISHYFQKINIFLPCIILSNSLDGIKRTSKTRILIYPNFSLPTTVHTEYLGENNLLISLSLYWSS